MATKKNTSPTFRAAGTVTLPARRRKRSSRYDGAIDGAPNAPEAAMYEVANEADGNTVAAGIRQAARRRGVKVTAFYQNGYVYVSRISGGDE